MDCSSILAPLEPCLTNVPCLSCEKVAPQLRGYEDDGDESSTVESKLVSVLRTREAADEAL